MNWILIGLLFELGATNATQEQSFCNCTRVMVVSPDQVSEPAANAFAAGLLPSVSVLPDAPLGDLTGTGDDEIATRAARFDVDTVVVVRTLAIPNGTNTLFTRYDVKSQTWSIRQVAQIVDAGPAILEATTHRNAALAAGESAQHEEAMSIKRGDFQRRYIAPTPVPYAFTVGVDKTPLDEANFYDHVGRPDLRQALNDNVSQRNTVMISSGVATALGTGLTFVGLLGGGADGEMPQLAMGIAGGVAVGLGISGLIYGAMMDTHPVDEAETKRLSDDFNQRLRHELELAR